MSQPTSTVRDRALAVIRGCLADLGIEWEETQPGTFSAVLPGVRKLRTDCALVVGNHSVEVRAFVARNPDENHGAVYRWLLERNLRTHGVAFVVDRVGDIYLFGRMSLESVTAAEVDRVLGSVAETSDESFNTILELGFSESIKKEWKWRVSRGESTANLESFRHLADPDDLARLDARTEATPDRGEGADDITHSSGSAD
ncbi:YbjN domain-containing protein [Mariniluteicoccus endophyticus]